MARRHAPATERNRKPILEVLRRVLPDSGRILEVACGTGQHGAFFAAALPRLAWQPSDPDPEARASTDAWCDALENVRPALALDAAADDWPVEGADAIYCANMVHIAPIEACRGLLRGAGRLLPPGGPLVLYGPFRQTDVPTAPSNEAFDRSLRQRDPAWGLRDLGWVVDRAGDAGLVHVATESMPANNLCVIFRAGAER